jgi:hypothetical protein
MMYVVQIDREIDLCTAQSYYGNEHNSVPYCIIDEIYNLMTSENNENKLSILF